MGGILVFGTFSIQCAAWHMDISAFVPLQDWGFGRAGGLAFKLRKPPQVQVPLDKNEGSVKA
jgi:hypothetical protein